MIDQSGRDWAALLTGWADALPTSFTAWLVNRFGDVIAVLDDGSVHLLDIGVGTFERVAQNRAHFAELVDEGGNVNKWLMIPLVDQCLAAGLVLGPNQCYGYKLPPLLGGEYTVQNVAAVDLAENYAFLSDLWRQTKGLPEGRTGQNHSQVNRLAPLCSVSARGEGAPNPHRSN